MSAQRLAFVTQVVDPDDPVLGFTVEWIRALACRTERMVVIANEVRSVPDDLGATVLSLGKEDGGRRPVRGARYIRYLVSTIRSVRPDALFVHMCPVYLNLAAPVLRAYRIPALLWFAHPRDSASLRLAERLAAVVLTSLPGAFPFPSAKVRVIGQAIPTEAFAAVPALQPTGELRLLALGRLSPVKGLTAMISAVATLRSQGVPAYLRIVGGATTDVEVAYAEELRRLAADLEGAVRLDPPVPYPQVGALLAACDVLVNATRAGSGDKVVLEAMAAGRLAVWSNPCFDGLADGLPPRLRYREDDPEDLAAVLRGIWEAPAELRAQVADELAARTKEAHSLDRWAARVVEIMQGLKG